MPETTQIRTVLSERISIWPRGTRVNILEPFGTRLLVEVLDTSGGMLDVLAVRREALTVTD